MDKSEPDSINEPSFDFAISYAGPDRSIATKIADLLSKSGARVFLDILYRAELLGKRLDHEFEWIFGPGTKYVVPIVSKSYVDRPWPQHEWSVATKEAQKRSEEFILPIRLDDSLLTGLVSQVAYLDLSTCPIDEAAKILVEKLTGPRREEISRWTATFGLAIGTLFESQLLPQSVPTYYPLLCDWLSDDLINHLRTSQVQNAKIVDDARDGETFSIRIAFDWTPKEGPLQFGEPAWWEVLEVLPYDQVYSDH